MEQVPAQNSATLAMAGQPAATPLITAYTLPPDRDQKARALSKVRLRSTLVDLVYGLIILLLVLWWKLAPKYRDVAERASSRRFLQILIFAPLIALTLDILSLPTGIYENWIERVYGLSVQGWGSWFWDWAKGELISVIGTIIVVWILYAVIHKSPRRWWFYFWLASLPLIVLLIFVQPLIIDPMFHKFEPLQQKDPALTAELEKMVRHAGQDIPPERMFWMGAGEKTTELNAYVTGFGASKRIVVWDTTIAKLSTPQIVFVAGHEMGHYVLHHQGAYLRCDIPLDHLLRFLPPHRLASRPLGNAMGDPQSRRLSLVPRAAPASNDHHHHRRPDPEHLLPVHRTPSRPVWPGGYAWTDTRFRTGGRAGRQYSRRRGSRRSRSKSLACILVLQPSRHLRPYPVCFALRSVVQGRIARICEVTRRNTSGLNADLAIAAQSTYARGGVD
jgi:Zn-dependent protease with chaperone function